MVVEGSPQAFPNNDGGGSYLINVDSVQVGDKVYEVAGGKMQEIWIGWIWVKEIGEVTASH